MADEQYIGLNSVTIGAMPATTQAIPSIVVSSDGLISASATQTAGYVTAGTKSATKQLTTKTATTITPTTSVQTAVESGVYTTGEIKVAAMPTVARANTTITSTADDTNDKLTFTASNNQSTGYVTGSNKTATKTVTLTASGANIIASDGTNSISKSVATTTQATPSIIVDSNGLITASTTQAAGYVNAGTKSATKQLTAQAAQTITPGTSNKTIASGRYLTGTQTIKGDANLKAANIKSGVSIFGVTGSLVGETIGAVSKGTIVVSYPRGATCTVTNGSVTYTALDTSGSAAFIVAAGTWTAKATSSSDSINKSVTVTAGKYMEVELSFNLKLYNPELEAIASTSEWIGVKSKTAGSDYSSLPTVTRHTDHLTIKSNGYGGCIFYQQTPVDLTEYKTLTLDGVLYVNIPDDVSLRWCILGIWNKMQAESYNANLFNVPYETTAVAKVLGQRSSTNRQIITLDVANLSGSHYIGFGLYSSATVEMYSLELSK